MSFFAPSVPRVSVVIVNYNAGTLLADCVAGLKAQSMAEFEAIIVDNGSEDGSLAHVPSDDPRFSVIAPGRNLGFAAGNNLAAASARAEWIATLNPDAVPRADWLERLLAATSRYPHASMFGSLQLSAEDPSVIDGAGDCYSVWGIPWRGGHGHRQPPPSQDMEVFGPCAAAALYPTALFRQVGGFDVGFFCYCEDVDLAFRLRLLGRCCIQVADAVVLHHGSALAGRVSDFTLFHSARNRVWTFVKNMPSAMLWITLPLFVAANLWLLLRWGRMGHFAPLWRGIVAAVRGLGPIMAARRDVQGSRRCDVWHLVRDHMAWSPRLLSLRAVMGRPVR